MTRQVAVLVFLGCLLVFAQPQPIPAFSKADMLRLLADTQKVYAANTKSGTQILAKQFSEEVQQAAKAPLDKRAAAMQKASDDYKKRIDAFNNGGQPSADLKWAVAIISNPMVPSNGFYQNLLDACMTEHRFLTRTEDGMPVLQQATVEGGITIIHTSPPGLPIEKTASSLQSPRSVCPTLVQNAIRVSPKTLAEVAVPSAMPQALQLCAAVCASLEWRNGHFEVMARDGQPGTIYTVESFTGGSIVMKRTELPHSGDYGLTAIYKGTFADGAETAQGTVEFTWPGKQGYPHSGKWTASWGGAVASAHPPSQKKPEERGEAEEAQAKNAREQQAQRLSIGILGAMAAMLGAGPNVGTGAAGTVSGDPAARILALQGQIDHYSSECSIHPQDFSGACAKARDTRAELSDAHAALSREIEALKAQADRLQKDCTARVAGACDKLNRVKAKLEADIEVNLASVF